MALAPAEAIRPPFPGHYGRTLPERLGQGALLGRAETRTGPATSRACRAACWTGGGREVPGERRKREVSVAGTVADLIGFAACMEIDALGPRRDLAG